ncbi:MAG: TIR domain-containing protein [Ruminococcaceae bacterium]|nr:TIR domain-containing protein [Oscillospiraceae bacterium]
MALLKCKMCGGNLEISDGATVIECDYCGTSQTVPDGNEEKKVNLFNRANRLRMDCEFDKASGVYESIVSEYPEESEGYWGLCLCKFGIEYVDDAATGKKIPTCHRTNTTSIMDDFDFEQALENADVVAKSVYREEAKAIDRLQRQIISVVESEEPYDVFICYKETDDITKQRTEDSAIAQDIYTELVREGYKVFFSRVTLRDRAGTEYEPYIYAALSSAKVMLAIGTKYDYYDAVWVKNEWSRYISMMADDNSRHLIPCFKNLDAYDIPKEFKNLQALDIGEMTFLKNLMDNVSRFVRTAKLGTATEKSFSGNAGALTKRGYLFLEDKDFESAAEYFERALDENPEDAKAYFGKVLVALRISSAEELEGLFVDLGAYKDFAKALRFAVGQDKAYFENIKENMDKKRQTLSMIHKENPEWRRQVSLLASCLNAIAEKFYEYM